MSIGSLEAKLQNMMAITRAPLNSAVAYAVAGRQLKHKNVENLKARQERQLKSF